MLNNWVRGRWTEILFDRISLIMEDNFEKNGDKVLTGLNRQDQKNFTLAALIGGNLALWSTFGHFGNFVRDHFRVKLHNLVSLRVQESVCFTKRKKVVNGILYQAQKDFSPGGPNIGLSLVRGILQICDNARNSRLFANIANSTMSHDQLKYWFWA